MHDLEVNPGPMEKKPNCLICNRTVRNNQAAIVCGSYDSCFQTKCSGLAKAALNKPHDSTEQWLAKCNLFGRPKLGYSPPTG